MKCLPLIWIPAESKMLFKPIQNRVQIRIKIKKTPCDETVQWKHQLHSWKTTKVLIIYIYCVYVPCSCWRCSRWASSACRSWRRAGTPGSGHRLALTSNNNNLYAKAFSKMASIQRRYSYRKFKKLRSVIDNRGHDIKLATNIFEKLKTRGETYSKPLYNTMFAHQS